ncbi:hypothetical protein I6E11_09945 [Bacteroides caecigallinarum]|uniref:hypothetical protein n=1 Tax=Bacteroides caecigallinarum TaxID=1411144 RepID=UPI001F3EBC22|nr:hypothetical protein [Bacteroides caecigallinarum]MCF2594098.1 hypothetical protein [Bacteroides caecigallinarum]
MKKTLIDLFEDSVRTCSNNNSFLRKGKEFAPTTYAQVKSYVYRLGAYGLRKGIQWLCDSNLYSTGLKICCVR